MTGIYKAVPTRTGVANPPLHYGKAPPLRLNSR